MQGKRAKPQELREFVRALQREYLPHCVVTVADPTAARKQEPAVGEQECGQLFLQENSSVYRSLVEAIPDDDSVSAHVCVGTTCGMPVRQVEKLLEHLS